MPKLVLRISADALRTTSCNESSALVEISLRPIGTLRPELLHNLGQKDIEGIDLGTAELGSTGLVAGNSTSIAKNIDVGEPHMTGHGAELAAIAVEVKDIARLVPMMTSTLPQLVHAGNADAWALATWRTSGLEARCPLCHRLVRHVTHRQSRQGKPR